MKYKLEYKVESSEKHDPTMFLNSLGEQGWELCAVVDSQSGSHKTYYFKRLLQK